MTAITVRRTIQPGGSDIRVSALLLLALSLAITGLHAVLEDITWWFGAFGVIFIVFTVAAVARYYLGRRWVGTVAALLAGLIVLTLLFASSTAILGFIPTGSTFVQFSNLLAAANDSIQRQSLPAFATTGIQFLIGFSVGGIAVVMDAVAIWLRAPALAGIPLLVVVVVPSFVLASLTDGFTFELTAIAYLLIVLSRGRSIQPAVAISAGVIAVLGALVVPAVLPPVAVGGTTGSGVGALAETINPIIDLGADLRQSDATPALSYTTTLPTGEYLRLTTLDTFQGKQWEPATPKLKPGNTVHDLAAPPGLSSKIKTVTVSTRVQVGEATGTWLPIPYPTRSIKGLTGAWSFENANLAVRSTTTSMQGERYTVTSLDVQPTIQQLEAAAPSVDNPLAKVPAGLNPIIAATAKQVVGTAKTDFDKAVALQSWFRGGDFTYSTRTPAKAGYDGSGLDVIVPFLKSKSGYCVHFASTMAVMARTLGIPSRIAVGFLPGKLTHVAGTAVYQVSSSNLHAWPELYFAGIGWVRFEPTPSRGFEPSFPSAPGEGVDVLPTATPTDVATSGPTATPVTAPKLPNQGGTVKHSAVQAPTTLPTSSYGVFGVLAVLLVLAAPAMIRASIRRRRTDRIRSGIDPAGFAWQELRETAKDLGVDARESSTPGELAAQLTAYLALTRRGTSEATEALARLRELVVDEVYGVPGYRYNGEEMADLLRTVVGGLRRATPVPRRFAATFIPPTLVDRLLGRAVARA